MFIFTYVHIYTTKHIHKNTYTHIQYTHIQIIYIYIYTFIHIYIYTCIHIYIYTYIHICVYRKESHMLAGQLLRPDPALKRLPAAQRRQRQRRSRYFTPQLSGVVGLRALGSRVWGFRVKGHCIQGFGQGVYCEVPAGFAG